MPRADMQWLEDHRQQAAAREAAEAASKLAAQRAAGDPDWLLQAATTVKTRGAAAEPTIQARRRRLQARQLAAGRHSARGGGVAHFNALGASRCV